MYLGTSSVQVEQDVSRLKTPAKVTTMTINDCYGRMLGQR
jgi:hypothetical protein